jgi:hypothetical protein
MEKKKDYNTIIVAAVLTIILAAISWSFKSNVENIYQRINASNDASCKANEIQWKKINEIEKDMAYMKGFRDGFLRAMERKPEHQ